MARITTNRRRDSDPPVFNPGGGDDGRDDDDLKPIGVSEGFRVPSVRTSESFRGMSPTAVEGWSSQGAGPGAIVERGPRYFDGDEWRPASLGPAAIGDLQAMMAAAGLLDDFRYGVWDAASVDAYKQLLTEANASGLTAEAALRQRAQGFNAPGGVGGAGGGGGGGSWQIDPETGDPVWVPEQYVPPPLELRTTNKDDLQRLFRETIINTMGEGWSKEQIRELVDAYNWQEIKVQQDAYNQQVAIERAEFMGERTEGGEVISTVDVPSPETFLENQLMERDPEGFQAGKIINEVLPDFFNMMEGWAGGGGG
jgi:hypothetical protein